MHYKILERVIPASQVVRKQRLHFLLWTVIPFVGSIAALLLATHYPISRLELLSWLGMWILTGGLGISVGFHRHFTHRAFEAQNWLRIMMAIAGSMAAQGSLIYWVSVHRRHHEQSDQQGDPHSPKSEETMLTCRIKQFWHGHMGWVTSHDVPLPFYYARDLLRDPSLEFVNKTYLLWMIIGLLIPGIIVGLVEQSSLGFVKGVLWGGLVRIFVGNQIIWSINSICHTWGLQDYDTADNSRNNFWLSIPAFGEGWHNNHHEFPYSANFGVKSWQLDIGYAAIWIMEKIGWVQNVKHANIRSYLKLM